MAVPTPDLVTERLQLRVPDPGRDAEALAAYVGFERERLMTLGAQRPAPWFTVASQREQAARDRALTDEGRSVVRLVFLRDEPERVAGRVTLSNIVRGAFQAAHLGYHLRRDLEGRGLATEAVRAVVEDGFGRLNLHRVMANHLPDNERSAGVLRRLGFHREGVAPRYLRIGGEWRDHVLNALVNDAWQETVPDTPPA